LLEASCAEACQGGTGIESTPRRPLISSSNCAVLVVIAHTEHVFPTEHASLSTQAGAFLPRLLEHAGLLETSKTHEKTNEETNEAILDLNVIIVYKKLVQGLIYSPPDCDKYLALDAKPQGSVALALTLAPTVAAQLVGLQRLRKRERE
jgi:hypothetical protein